VRLGARAWRRKGLACMPANRTAACFGVCIFRVCVGSGAACCHAVWQHALCLQTCRFDPALCCVHRAAALGPVRTGTHPEGEGAALLGSCSDSTACPWAGHSSARQHPALGLSRDVGWTWAGLDWIRASWQACLQRRRAQEACKWRGVCVCWTALGAFLLGSPVLLKWRSCTWSGSLATALCGCVSQLVVGQLLGARVQAATLALAAFVLELLGFPLARSAGQQLEAFWRRLGRFEALCFASGWHLGSGCMGSGWLGLFRRGCCTSVLGAGAKGAGSHNGRKQHTRCLLCNVRIRT
jgi:hypothetical protein